MPRKIVHAAGAIPFYQCVAKQSIVSGIFPTPFVPSTPATVPSPFMHLRSCRPWRIPFAACPSTTPWWCGRLLLRNWWRCWTKRLSCFVHEFFAVRKRSRALAYWLYISENEDFGRFPRVLAKGITSLGYLGDFAWTVERTAKVPQICRQIAPSHGQSYRTRSTF